MLNLNLPGEFEALTEIFATQVRMRKIVNIVFAICLFGSTPLLIMLPPDTFGGLRIIISVAAMFAIIGLVFLGRAALIVTSVIYRKQKVHHYLLQHTESDDFKLAIGDALFAIRKRREQAAFRRTL